MSPPVAALHPATTVRVLRNARTAPWATPAPTVEPAAVAAASRLRGRCARIAAGSPAGVTHRACPPPVVHARGADLLGDAARAADAYGPAAWAARRSDPNDPTGAAHRARSAAGSVRAAARAAAASSPTVPAAALWASMFDADPAVAVAAAANPVCPTDLLRAAAAGRRVLVGTPLAANPALPTELFAGVVAATALPVSLPQLAPLLRTGSTLATLSAAAAHPASPTPLLEALSRHPGPAIRQAVAANPACPPRLRLELRADNDRSVAAAACAADPSTVPTLAAAHRGERMCVLAAATNPNCAAETLAALVESCPGYAQRQAIGAHPACPADLREMLGGDTEPGVAAAAHAADPSSDPRRVARLGGHCDPAVRAGSAGNPVCPPAVLRRLDSDPHPRVRAMAAANPAQRSP